jgi:ribosomal protein S18 acetylase RimI-like enzyme
VTAPITIQIADYAKFEHKRALEDLLDLYARDPMGGGTALDEVVKTRFVSGLAASPSAFSLLAYSDDRPVGLANCFWGYSTFQAKSLINVHDLVTHPDYRGRGIGSALLGEVERIGREAGCCKLTLEVLTGNHGAMALYQSLGFGDYVLDPEQGHAVFWQKKL